MSRFGRWVNVAAVAALAVIGAAPAVGQEATQPAPAPLPNVTDFLTRNPPVQAGFGPPARPTALPGYPTPCQPCLPCNPSVPGAPATPGDTTPPGTIAPDPNAGTAPPRDTPAPTFQGRGAGLGSTVSTFGDFLGGRPSQVTVGAGSRMGLLNGSMVVYSVPGTLTPSQSGVTINGNLQNATLRITNSAGQTLVPSRPIPIGGAFTQTGSPNVPFSPTGSAAALTNYLNRYIQGPPGTAVPAPPGVAPVPRAVPVGIGYTLAAQAEHALNPNALLTQFSLSAPQERIVPTGAGAPQLQFVSTITDRVGTLTTINIPAPGGGGSVGLIKASEDNNPLPRDRIIFDYDNFDRVPFGTGMIPVNRYQFGLEKTFFDGWASVEVRVPFANTLNGDQTLGTGGTNTEFGNLRLTSKVLLLRGETVNVSSGLAVYLPTASGFNVYQTDGTNLLHVANTSVQLAPYVAALYTPNERLFAQSWVGMTFDTGGNQVTVNPDAFGGPASAGGLRAGTTLQADVQVGYWVYRAQSGLVQGVAPFAELHYNGTVENGQGVTTGTGTYISGGGPFHELNISGGVTTILSRNSTLAVGFSAPLLGATNRSFDYQVGVRLSWFFGYTARQRTPGAAVSSFGL